MSPTVSLTVHYVIAQWCPTKQETRKIYKATLSFTTKTHQALSLSSYSEAFTHTENDGFEEDR